MTRQAGRDTWDAVGRLMRTAIADRATPAVTIDVGRLRGSVWTEAFGRLTYEQGALPCRVETVFDLASLTKVMATASVVMRAVADGRLDLECPLRELAPGWQGPERERTTLRHLLDHSSGLPAHRAFWKESIGPDALDDAICTLPLERPPGRASVYSDVGFILLGLIVARALGKPLDALFEPITAGLDAGMCFNPGVASREEIAPTEFDPWRGRMLQGDVHDENAALLGGVAGHAGLFGGVQSVGAFARLVLETFTRPTVLGDPQTMLQFASRSSVPGSSRALGWDTMLPTSSCGTKFSARAIGHTGFTGTSLWIDPELDVYVALLSNRVHPTRTNNKWHALRPTLHDAVLDALAA
jgi:CubicO group peptidase (beta-lactamase class C family)